MKLQDSPNLEEFSEGIPEEPKETQKSSGSKTRLRVVISILGAVILLLFMFKGWQSETFDLLTGKGILSGYAVDENETPVKVEVLIFATDIRIVSDSSGYFEVNNVPSGEQSVIVAYGDVAVEVAALVEAGVDNHIGKITVPTDMDTE